MKHIKLILIILIVLMFFLHGNAQEKTLDQQLREGGKATQFTDSPVYHFFYHCTIELDNQGMINRKVHHFFQLLNQAARDEESNYRLTFNKEYQDVSVSRAETVIKEGGTMAVEKTGINEVTPPALSDTGIYSNMADRVYSFPKTRPGDGIHIEYEIKNRKKFTIPFSGCLILYKDEPGENIVYSLITPKKIFYRTTGDVEVIEKDNRIDFKIKNSPYVPQEPNSIPLDVRSPKVFFSETMDWNSVLSPFASELEQKSTPDPVIKSFVEDLTKNARTSVEKRNEIYNFITQSIRKIFIPIWHNGYEANHASLILKNRYADVKDSAVLMLAFLKAAGLNAYPVLYNFTGQVSDEIPNLDQYNGLLIAVEENNSVTLLNPFSEYYPVDYQGIALSSKGRALKPGFPVINLPLSENIESIFIRSTMKENDRAAFQIKIVSKGYNDYKLRRIFYYWTQDETKRYLENMAQKFVDGAILKKYKISDLKNLTRNFEMTLDIEADNPSISQKTITFLTLPEFSDDQMAFSNFLGQRKSPLYLNYQVKKTVKYDILLEKGTRLIYVPGNLEGKCPDFKTQMTCQYDKAHNTIVFEKEIKNLESLYSPEKYTILKEGLNDLEHWKNNTILWEKIKK